jgi:hypothetical protein
MDVWITCHYMCHNAFVERFIFLLKDIFYFNRITFLCNYDLSTLSTAYLNLMQINFVWSFHFRCHNIATIKILTWSCKYKEREGSVSFRKHIKLDPISHRDFTNYAQTMEMEVNNLVHPQVKRINTQGGRLTLWYSQDSVSFVQLGPSLP